MADGSDRGRETRLPTVPTTAATPRTTTYGAATAGATSYSDRPSSPKDVATETFEPVSPVNGNSMGSAPNEENMSAIHVENFFNYHEPADGGGESAIFRNTPKNAANVAVAVRYRLGSRFRQS